MPKPLYVVSSDNHLMPHTWAKYPELKHDSYFSFQQIIAYAIKSDLDIILAGDVLDKRQQDPETIGFLFDQLFLLEKAGHELLYIQGQHELSRNRPWLDCFGNTIYIHRNSVGNDLIYGIDFTPADKLQAELDKIPSKTKVLVAHQVWKEHCGKHCTPEASFSDVPHVSTIITGDFHRHMVTEQKGKAGQKLTVASPGSTFMRAIDEESSKFFFVMNDDLTFTSIAIITRPIFRKRIGTVDFIEEFIKEFTAFYAKIDHSLPASKPICYVEYFDSVPNAAVRIQSFVDNKAFMFLRPLSTTTPDRVSDELIEVDEQTASGLESYLSRCVDQDDPTYKTTLRLLRSNDIKGELKKLVIEAIEEDSALR
jgi:hypothetical protein